MINKWDLQIDHVESKLKTANIMLYRLRNVIPMNLLKSVYYAFANSHITYGITAWGITYKSNISKIISKQKFLIRTITFSKKMAHTKDLFDKLNILSITKQIKYNIILPVSRAAHEKARNRSIYLA